MLKNNIVVNGNNLAGEIFSGISYTNPEIGEFLKQQFEETLDIN